MTSRILERYRLTVAQLLRVKLYSGTYLNYSEAKTNQNPQPDYEINEQILLSAENRQRCMEKMCSVPPVGIKLRAAKPESKFAAVLIAICTDGHGQNLSILYTRRSRMLRSHMRQISFPGGIKDEHEDYIQCALRETEEEIGLPSSRIEIWGSGSLITPPHTAAIMPVVGVVKNFKESELKLNTDEVEEAFVVPIKKLAHPQTLRHTQYKSGYSSAVFVVDDDKHIWGITGFMTNIFMNCFLPPQYNRLKRRVKFIRPFKIESTS